MFLGEFLWRRRSSFGCLGIFFFFLERERAAVSHGCFKQQLFDAVEALEN